MARGAIMPAADGGHGRVVNRRARNRPGSLVRHNQKIANGDVVFKLAPCRFNRPWTWLRHRSEYANDFLALQGCYRSIQEPERLEFLN